MPKDEKSKTQRGKKGGLSIFSPETIGAMTGAAIGGLTGLFLGSRKTKPAKKEAESNTEAEKLPPASET